MIKIYFFIMGVLIFLLGIVLIRTEKKSSKDNTVHFGQKDRIFIQPRLMILIGACSIIIGGIIVSLLIISAIVN